jgi:hypothetical protein
LSNWKKLVVSGSGAHLSSVTASNGIVTTGSLLITGSKTIIGQSYLTGSLFITGSEDIVGYLGLQPVASLPIPTDKSASYIYTSGSTNDLYFTQYQGSYTNTTRLRWIEGNMFTGLLYGGTITSASATTFNVDSGSGIVVTLNATTNTEPYPTIKYVNWPSYTSQSVTYRTSSVQTFIGIDANGQIIQQIDPWTDGQFNTSLSLGTVIHQNLSTINAINFYPQVAYGYKQRSYDFIKAFGSLKLSGYNIVPTGSLGLQVGSGTAFADGRNYTNDPNNPSYIIDPGTAVSKIFRYYQSGSTFIQDTNSGSGYTVLDPSKYNNNGTLTSVSPSIPFTIQRIFWYPNSVTKGIIAYYGNQQYDSITAATANLPYETFNEVENTKQNAIYLGAIVLRYNADFNTSGSYLILPGGVFRAVGGQGGGGNVPTSRLTDLSDVDAISPAIGDLLSYNGSVWAHGTNLVGNYTLTGSLYGTASYATNALTASYALSYSGTSGTSGANGSSGTSGTSGANGSSGTSGTSGANGSSGSSGTSGTSGANGSSGTSGANGSSGTSGENGTSGTSGANGTSGSSGTSGANGSSGSSGTSGANGSSGSSGTSGTSGANGSSGTSGANGSSGTSGVNGSNGSSGTSGTGFTTVVNAADNRILTSDGTSNSAVAETNLTFDGTTLTLTGDAVVTGRITAQEFHTEFVSASILFESGSTKLGNTSDDIHQVTGSMSITGSLTVDSPSPITLQTSNLLVGISSGDEGGEILLVKPQTNTVLTGSGITIDAYQNKIRFFEQGGAARGGYFDLTELGAGASTNLLSVGTSGTSGNSGTSGTSGNSGSSGTSGNSGSSGTSGETGASGTSGTSGNSGSSGSSGTSGENGTSGTSGANGTSGSSGTSGANGTSGSSGTSGANGTSGSSGTSGENGTSGTSGANGTSGSSGTSGANGTSGTSGANGTSGSSGTSGANGANGTSGTSGSSGTSGANGTSGSSGTSGTGFTTITNAVDNRILTSDGTANSANAETNLTFNGSTLDVTGNVTATSFTGSLQGTATTASYVLNAVSSSFATTASYVLGGGGASVTNPGNNYLITSDGTVGGLTGENNLNFDGTIFNVTGSAIISATTRLTDVEERELTVIIGGSPTSLSLDLSLANVFEVTYNANVNSFSIVNAPPTDYAGSFTLVTTGTGTPYPWNWGSAVTWSGGSAPSVTSTNGKKDIYGFISTNQGTNWYGFIGGQNL